MSPCWLVRCARQSPSSPEATSRRLSTARSPTPRAARRAGTVAAVGRTRSAIEGLALDDLTLLVRALGHELHLANLAEQAHRLRRRRQRDDGTPLPESIADARRAPAGRRGARRAEIPPRRARRRPPRAGADGAPHRGRAPHVPAEPAAPRGAAERARRAVLSATRRSDIAGAIAEEATILWLSDDVRSIRPTVDDEIRQGLWFFEKSLVHAAAELAGEWHRNLPGTPPPIAFRTWIGGDQDGNPNAGPDDVLRALARARSLLVAHYRREVRELSRALGLSARWRACRTSWQPRSTTRQSCRGCDDDVGVRNTTEPYRRKLTAIWRRLDNELAGRDEPVYADAAGLQRDLDLIDASLRANHGARIADGRLAVLRRTVAIFGMHLARLDLRMHVADVRAGTDRARATIAWRRPSRDRPPDHLRHVVARRHRRRAPARGRRRAAGDAALRDAGRPGGGARRSSTRR